MPLKDPEARRAYQSQYNRGRYHSDPEFKKRHIGHVRAVDQRRKKVLQQVIRDFRHAGCHACGEMDPCCLVAHHTDPEQKEFDLGNAIRRKYGLQRVIEELKKCVCLCMNCHAKLHAGVIKLSGIEQPGSLQASYA